jgi:hypothetical protein
MDCATAQTVRLSAPNRPFGSIIGKSTENVGRAVKADPKPPFANGRYRERSPMIGSVHFRFCVRQ